MLDVAFPLLAKVLGGEDDPLGSIAVPHLLAIAYSAGWAGSVQQRRTPRLYCKAGGLERQHRDQTRFHRSGWWWHD